MHKSASFKHNNLDRCCHVNFRNSTISIIIIIIILPQWVVFSKKRKKLLTKFPGLATLGRYNYTMIADRQNFTTKWSPYLMSSFHFYR